MLDSQRLTIRRVELQEQLNAPDMLEIRPADTGQRAKRTELETQLKANDSELKKALKDEGDAQEKGMAMFSGSSSPESREMKRLATRGSVNRIIKAAVRGWGIADGVEHELQSHFDLDSNAIPLVMLLDEERAAATFGTTPGEPGTTPGIAGQVFGDSASAFANVRFEDVDPGVRVWPVITTGSLDNVGTPVRSAENAETDAVLAVKELKPKRAQVSFAYTLEDAATYPGLDRGLRENIRAGLRDKIDDVILNRTSEGLLQFGTAPTAHSSATTAAQYLAAVAAGVDGRFAGREGEVKVLVGSGPNGVYGHMAGLAIATGDGRTVTDKLGERVRVSPHVPAYSSDMQDAVVCKGNSFQTVAAIWPGIPILVDNASRAPQGEVRLYGVLMHDFAILRTDGYTRHRFRTS